MTTQNGKDLYAVKIDVALEQLDWSIKLFIDHKQYVAAITLAGAAEEILGKLVGEKASVSELTKKLSLESGIEEKEVRDGHLNKARNWFKHCDSATNVTIDLELEVVTIQYIVRAMANLLSYDESLPSEGQKFFAWLASNRPDLGPPHPQ
jgi:hypothetical protein